MAADNNIPTELIIKSAAGRVSWKATAQSIYETLTAAAEAREAVLLGECEALRGLCRVHAAGRDELREAIAGVGATHEEALEVARELRAAAEPTAAMDETGTEAPVDDFTIAVRNFDRRHHGGPFVALLFSPDGREVLREFIDAVNWGRSGSGGKYLECEFFWTAREGEVYDVRDDDGSWKNDTGRRYFQAVRADEEPEPDHVGQAGALVLREISREDAFAAARGR